MEIEWIQMLENANRLQFMNERGTDPLCWIPSARNEHHSAMSDTLERITYTV